jgi:hypothetical protein
MANLPHAQSSRMGILARYAVLASRLLCLWMSAHKEARNHAFPRFRASGQPLRATGDQKSQSSSSVSTALPITYDEPDPEKKSWFSSAFGDSAARIAGLTSVSSLGNSAS